MSIRCVCANGHVLKVKESLAGTSGLCPTCRVRVDIPTLRQQAMSEDAILDILGHDNPARQGAASEAAISTEDSRRHLGHEQITHKKTCHKCKRGFPTTMHICPYCHTYIATLRDF